MKTKKAVEMALENNEKYLVIDSLDIDENEKENIESTITALKWVLEK